MAELLERDAMTCRACGKEERASEGYPCADCARFICNMCNMRGVVRCRECAQRTPAGAPNGGAGDGGRPGEGGGGSAEGGPSSSTDGA